jgi:hypothetical protein
MDMWATVPDRKGPPRLPALRLDTICKVEDTLKPSPPFSTVADGPCGGKHWSSFSRKSSWEMITDENRQAYFAR